MITKSQLIVKYDTQKPVKPRSDWDVCASWNRDAQQKLAGMAVFSQDMRLHLLKAPFRLRRTCVLKLRRAAKLAQIAVFMAQMRLHHQNGPVHSLRPKHFAAWWLGWIVSIFHIGNITVFVINGNIKDLPTIISGTACFFWHWPIFSVTFTPKYIFRLWKCLAAVIFLALRSGQVFLFQTDHSWINWGDTSQLKMEQSAQNIFFKAKNCDAMSLSQ